MSKPVLTLEDGGPAFPLGPYDLEPGLSTLPVHGMSLRDWFAGQCIVGYEPAGREDAETLARSAYSMADAMLSVRLRAAIALATPAEGERT